MDGVTFDYPADGFTEGVIGGRPVPCLSVTQQLRFREGHPPRDVDHHDIALLRAVPGADSPGRPSGVRCPGKTRESPDARARPPRRASGA
ncbi:nucleotidyltransferase domain-containing protein [Micromonospora sp. R77]|uniref:nucleotidyltransferase domain-containing protein n=1 Tax=Micromonospora sp. R77 TaxID=2925836 RepID=UPI0035B13179